jgi:hypothetical protein
MARATRESSPPLAIRASGRAGSPGLARSGKRPSRRPNRRRRRARRRSRRPARRSGRATRYRHLEARLAETQAAERFLDGLGEQLRRRLTATGEDRRGGHDQPKQARGLGLTCLARGLQRPQPLGFGRGPLAVCDHRRLVLAVLALQRVDQREPLLQQASAAGSCSTLSARPAASAAASSSSAARPSSRSATGSYRSSSLARSRARWAASAWLAGAGPLPRQQPRGSRRCRGRSTPRAGPMRAGPESRPPRRRAAFGALDLAS